MTYELELPPDFEEYAWEVESKGVFWDALVLEGEQRFSVTFYDKQRLAQDLSEELGDGRVVVLNRVVVVERVTVECMSMAVGILKPGELK